MKSLISIHEPGASALHNAGATSAIDFANGPLQKCTVSANASITISNGSEGSRLELWVKNTGNSTVTITPSATPPSASSATTWDIEAGLTAIFLFRKLSGGWAWSSVTGNF